MNLDNSESILPDYIDTEALRKEAELKETSFSNAVNYLTEDLVARAQTQPETATQIETRKQDMKAVIEWYKFQNDTMKQTMSTTSADTQDYVAKFNTKKADVQELRKKVEAERQLQTIREEQVKSLENREEANYHTSWMGLEKPLKPESHAGLAVAAGAFGLVAILVAIYLYRGRNTSTSPDFTSFFRGGFRAMRRLGRYSV